MAKDKFADDSTPPQVSSPNVSPPVVNAPQVNPPDTQTPSGDGILGRMLESVGLRVVEDGSA